MIGLVCRAARPPALPARGRAALSRERAYGLVGILVPRFVIAVLMVVPRVVKAVTQASAISAAATAYSESSRPVSSRKNFFNICFCSFRVLGLLSRGFQARARR